MSVRINNKLVASNARQTNSDWNATTGGAAILNKPTNLVHTTGNETIAGDKTFENKILLNSPSYSGPQGFIYQGESTGPLFIGLQNSSGSFSNNVIYLYQNAQTLIKSTTNVQLEGTTPATTNVAPTEDTTSSIQIDTVGARNTKLANYVTLSTSQTITGEKTFTQPVNTEIQTTTSAATYQDVFRQKDNNLDITQIPSYSKTYYYAIKDKNGRYLGYLSSTYGTDGSSTIGLTSRTRNTANTDNVNSYINVRSYKNGAINATCPTPTEDTTSSIQIDTVGARNTKLANYALDNNTVHKSGDETINDTKTFTNDVYVKKSLPHVFCDKSDALWSDNPEENSGGGNFEIRGSDGAWGCIFGSEKYTDGRRTAKMQVMSADRTKTDRIHIGINSSNVVYTYAPTPAANSNDTNIATTAWCYDPSLSTNLVHRTGNETITGQKTFNVTVKLNQIQSTGTGTGDADPHVNFIDMDGGPSLGGKGAYVAIEDGTAGQWNKIATVQGNNTFTGVNTFNQTVQGTAYRALYADLAEYYEMDMKYPTGTLVQFGGLNEMTIASTEVNAVISENPAFIMNGKETENSQPVALIGKVKIRVEGKVNKFDKLTLSENPGIAKVSTNDNDIIIGRALESKDFEEESLVLSSVKIKLG